MRRIFALSVLLSAPSSAYASWELVRGDSACGISADWQDDGNTNILLVESAREGFALEVTNENWTSIKSGEDYPLTLAFDDKIFTVKATGFAGETGMGLRFGGGEDLGLEFGRASRFVIIRDAEKPIPVLAVKLTGSMAAMSKLKPCVDAVRREQRKSDAEADALARKRAIVPADPFYDPNAPTAAVPLGNPARWVTYDDFPASAMREGRGGVAGFRLKVGADGTVTDCAITSSTGHADLDAETCAVVTRRARFKVAAPGSGERFYSSRITWAAPE